MIEALHKKLKGGGEWGENDDHGPKTEVKVLLFLPLRSSGAKLSHDNSLERDRRGLWEFLERGTGAAALPSWPDEQRHKTAQKVQHEKFKGLLSTFLRLCSF